MYARAGNLNKTIQMDVSSTNERSSYDPNSFGPALWFTLHNAATTYPEIAEAHTQQGMQQLLTNMDLLIPCGLCKQHWSQTLKKFDLNHITKSRENLFAFLVHAHNFVNQMSEKPQMSIEEAKTLYGYNRKGFGSIVSIKYA